MILGLPTERASTRKNALYVTARTLLRVFVYDKISSPRRVESDLCLPIIGAVPVLQKVIKNNENKMYQAQIMAQTEITSFSSSIRGQNKWRGGKKESPTIPSRSTIQLPHQTPMMIGQKFLLHLERMMVPSSTKFWFKRQSVEDKVVPLCANYVFGGDCVFQSLFTFGAQDGSLSQSRQ